MEIFTKDVVVKPFSEEWKIMKEHFQYIKKDTPLLANIYYKSKTFSTFLWKSDFDGIVVFHYPIIMDYKLYDDNKFTDAEKYEFGILMGTFFIGLFGGMHIFHGLSKEECIKIFSLVRQYVKKKYQNRFTNYARLWFSVYSNLDILI